MSPENHTCGPLWPCRGLRACFPCTKSHPDPRTTRNFRHFRQGFKQNSKVRRLGRHFATSQYWDGIGAKASSNKASNTIPLPNTGTVLEASLKSASIRLQMRFPNTGTGFEAEETWNFYPSKWTSNHKKSCWVSHWPRDAAGRILVRGLLQVTTFRRRMKVSSCIGKKCTKTCPSMHGALVASHHQPRNLNIVRANQCLGNSWLARSTSRSCTELTLKQFSDNPMGRRTTVARIPLPTCRNQGNMLCPTAKPRRKSEIQLSLARSAATYLSRE